MAGPLLRRILGVTILALCAGPARAGEGRASFTVSAMVVRSAAVRVEAIPVAGGVRVAAAVERPGAEGAGLALSPSGERGRAPVARGALSAAIAGGRRVMVVTVLPDGAPPAIRLRD